jgi:hypothetical protein
VYSCQLPACFGKDRQQVVPRSGFQPGRTPIGLFVWTQSTSLSLPYLLADVSNFIVDTRYGLGIITKTERSIPWHVLSPTQDKTYRLKKSVFPRTPLLLKSGAPQPLPKCSEHYPKLGYRSVSVEEATAQGGPLALAEEYLHFLRPMDFAKSLRHSRCHQLNRGRMPILRYSLGLILYKRRLFNA